MYVGESGCIGDDSVGYKRLLSLQVQLYTRTPAALYHLGDPISFLLNGALAKALHLWDQAGVLVHVSHDLFRITTNGVELQIRLTDEALEGIVRSYSHAMSVLL
jgi:hypothetical protein